MKIVYEGEFEDKPTEIKKFLIGGMWEDYEWEIHFNEPVTHADKRSYPHCKEPFIYRRKRSDGSHFDTVIAICPRVIVARNEGGYNTTGVCLDCVLEATKGLLK